MQPAGSSSAHGVWSFDRTSVPMQENHGRMSGNDDRNGNSVVENRNGDHDDVVLTFASLRCNR